MAVNRDKGQTFLRVFRLLETLAESTTPLNTTDISSKIGVPRPSVVRLCSLLEKEGLLQRQIDGKRYVIGPRVSKFSTDVIAGNARQVERHAILNNIVAKVRETCNIVMSDRIEMVIVDRIESNWAVRAHMEVGTRVPLYCSSSGKLFLSSLPRARRRSLLEKLDIKKKYAANSIVDIDLLEQEIESVRRQKFSIDNEELLDGMVAVAVPIEDEKGQFCAALSAQGAVYRFPPEVAKEQVPFLKNAAQELAALIR